jgi:electron transfer flavoprotein beta subunit
MRFVVCVKEVPAGSSRRAIDPGTLRLRRDGDCELNAFDAHALEEALRLLDDVGSGEVVALSLGPPRAGKSLRRCLALGATRAVLVSDEAAAGSDLVATTAVLGRLLERERPDLILFGQQAEDSDGGLLYAAVADRLRLPAISKAGQLEIVDGKLQAWRSTEDGRELVRLPLPAVVAVSRAANEPRQASLKGSIEARKRPLEECTLAGLGLDPAAAGERGSRTVVHALSVPELARGRERFEGDAGHAAEHILAFLTARGVLET